MLNVPTDLLRTLVTVVDLRSFTKAAQSLGVTQPAVSAQIKRLQHLLGYDLLDKRVPGVSLTPRGEIVVTHARRLLSINDEILMSTSGKPMTQTLRVGIPGDYSGSRIPSTLARFRLRWPNISFHVGTDTAENLIRDLKQGDLDVIVAITDTQPVAKPRHQWTREAVWVRGDALRLDHDRPVPLVAYSDDCACQRVAMQALTEAGRECEFVFSSRSLFSLVAAVAAGFGVMVMPRARALKTNLAVWDDAPLPKLPDLYCNIFVRDGGNRAVLEELADNLAHDLQAQPQFAAGQPPPGTIAPIRASKVGH